MAAWLLAACAPSVPPQAATGPAVLAQPGSPQPESSAQAPAEPTPLARSNEPGVVRLTGGVGNQVVGSFDQLRAAVGAVQGAIDACYRSTAAEGGWRDNLMWDLEVSTRGTVTRVTLHDAEYWRGGKVVRATPGQGLATCMEQTLRRLRLSPPVQAGSVRLRFEL